jgi:hypothetical protein
MAIFDIDGVLADVRHRLHYVSAQPRDWKQFFSAAPLDPPLAQGYALVEEMAAAGHDIVYVTGRPEMCRVDTESWLARHGMPTGELWMRNAGDRRPGHLVKRQLIARLATLRAVALVVDDDAEVLGHMSVMGYPVCHATWMTDNEAEALHDVQREGLT